MLRVILELAATYSARLNQLFSTKVLAKKPTCLQCVRVNILESSSHVFELQNSWEISKQTKPFLLDFESHSERGEHSLACA